MTWELIEELRKLTDPFSQGSHRHDCPDCQDGHHCAELDELVAKHFHEKGQQDKQSGLASQVGPNPCEGCELNEQVGMSLESCGVYIVPSMECHKRIFHQGQLAQRAKDEKRLQEALGIAERYGSIDGDHHKMWVIDQMARVLTGTDYEAWVVKQKEGEDGPDTYEWDTGIAP